MDNIFRILKSDKNSQARTGILTLPHGEVKTPAFMPVGTNGTVKGMHHTSVAKIGYNLILGNTYHLYLRPGIEVLESYGGTPQLLSLGWEILTPQWGVSNFFPAKLRKLEKRGLSFNPTSWLTPPLTPERVVEIQKNNWEWYLDVPRCVYPYRNLPPPSAWRWRLPIGWAERSLEGGKSLEILKGNSLG